MLFDAVPGGAGGTLQIARSFDRVLETALQRVDRCECGEETSRYGCQRNFRNQAFHDQLRRGDALAFLTRLVSKLASSGTGSECLSMGHMMPVGQWASGTALVKTRVKRMQHRQLLECILAGTRLDLTPL
jgi:ATP-dependent helicase YprA (DUF1998 family)